MLWRRPDLLLGRIVQCKSMLAKMKEGVDRLVRWYRLYGLLHSVVKLLEGLALTCGRIRRSGGCWNPISNTPDIGN